MRGSEDEQIEEGVPCVQSANDFGQERRNRQHLDLLARRCGVEPEGGNSVGDHQLVEGRIADRLFGARHEQTVRHHRHHAAGAGLTRRPRGADERGAGRSNASASKHPCFGQVA